MLLLVPAIPIAQGAPQAARAQTPVLSGFAFEDTLPDGTPEPLANGDTLRVRLDWSVPDAPELADSLEITADFSRLESPSAGPTWVESLGGGSYRLSHLVPLDNTRADAGGIPVPVTADLDGVQVTDDTSIQVCLSNRPPEHLGTVLLEDDPVFTLGDSLRIRTIWRSRDGLELSVTPMLDSLLIDPRDTGFTVEAADDTTYVLRLQLPQSSSSFRDDRNRIPLPLRAEDSGCGASSDMTLFVNLDTEGPAAEDLVLDEVPLVTYRDSVDVTGGAANARAVRIHLPDGSEIQTPVEEPDSPEPSPFAARVGLEMGVNQLLVQAADSAGNLSAPAETLRITRQRGTGFEPILLRYAVADSLEDGSPAPIHSGDTIRITTWWTVPDTLPSLADSLEVAADFSELDGDTPGTTDVVRLEGVTGAYLIIHYTAPEIGRPDGKDIIVPMTALGPTGFTNDKSLRLCLSNHPPIHLGTRLLDPKAAPYRTGDSLRIETNWYSPAQLPMNVGADLSNVLANPLSISPKVTQTGDSTFVIRLRLPLSANDLLPDGPNKPIPIEGRDSGCGSTVDRSLRIAQDTEAPPSEGLTLDPLPGVVQADSILVSGYAPEASVALILRDRTVKAAVEPDSATGRFSATIGLAMGRNQIQARSEDEAGNSTTLTQPALTVYRVDGADLSVGSPYSRDDHANETEDDIVLRDPGGMARALIRIYSLEGDCVAEAEDPAPGNQFSWHWDGRGADGERASQGYYIVRAEWTDSTGRRRQVTQGLLLRD